MGKLRNIWKYAFVWGTVAEAPGKQAKLFKRLVEKSMETCKILKSFMNY